MMMRLPGLTLAALLAFGQVADAAVVQITVKDAAGTTRNVNVTTNTDITGNLSWNNVICDQAAGTTCATVTGANALKVDNSAVTQPISAAALPLPSGAATAALQSGVQGTAVPGTSPTNMNLAGARYNATPPTLTDGQTAALQVDVNGRLILSLNTNVTLADALSNATGVAPVGSYNLGYNGTTWDRLQVDGSKNLKVVFGSAQAVTQSGTWTVGQTSQYPAGATAITASATGTTGATTATLAGTSGKTTYICGYSIRANATAATNVTNTVTGVITATLSSIMGIPANTAGAIGVDEQIFSPCVPASATNTGIAIVSGAPGTGGLVSSKGWGYQL